MYRLLIFLASFFFNKVFGAQYQACTGFHINTTYYNYQGKYEPVYKYSFDNNINLNKNFADKNEITISNYTHWSFNEGVYYRNKSSICASLGSYYYEPTDYPCFQWIPSNNTFIQELPFQEYELFYYIQIDSKIEKDSFQFLFDKKFMAFQYYGGRLVENTCGNTSYSFITNYDNISNSTICCNNFITVTIPDTSEINSDIDVKGCNKSSNGSSSCYLDTTSKYGGYYSYNYAYNFLLSPIFNYNSPYFGIIVSKLRVINGIPLKENFEAFTRSDPCWTPPNSIPFVNSSMKADISFCCTSFGQQSTSVSTSSTGSTTTTSFIPEIQTTDSANTLTCNMKNSFVFIVAFVFIL